MGGSKTPLVQPQHRRRAMMAQPMVEVAKDAVANRKRPDELREWEDRLLQREAAHNQALAQRARVWDDMHELKQQQSRAQESSGRTPR